MLRKLLLAALITSMTYSVMQAAPGVRFNVIKGDAEAPYNTMVNKKLKTAGFVLSDPHARINDGYATKYGGTNLTNLGFFSVASDKAMRELFLKEPSLGGFVPFNLHIYKAKAEGKTYVGHVIPSVMLDIVGVKDPAVRKAFEATFTPLDKLVQDSLGGEVKLVGSNKIAAKPMMEFELAFDRGDDLVDFVDSFQEKFEEKFEEMKYIIAGYKNFKEAYNDLKLPFDRFDKYWVYSLCHFKFSEGIFNQGRPDAGVFAPCSMYMYIEKGSSVLKIGMPTLHNWISVMGIKNPTKVKAIEEIDSEIIKLMQELGAKRI